MPLVGDISEQQRNVYEAQQRTSKLKEFISIKEVQIFLDEMTASDWWTNFGYDFIVRIEAQKSPSRICSISTRQEKKNLGIVALTENQMNAQVTLHEVAHCLAPNGAGHTGAWVRIYLNLVYQLFGSQSYIDLYNEFTSSNVDVG